MCPTVGGDWPTATGLFEMTQELYGLGVNSRVTANWRRTLAEGNAMRRGTHGRAYRGTAELVAPSSTDLGGGPISVEAAAAAPVPAAEVLGGPPLVFVDEPARVREGTLAPQGVSLAKPAGPGVEELTELVGKLVKRVEELESRAFVTDAIIEELTAKVNSLNNIKTAAKLLLQEVMS